MKIHVAAFHAFEPWDWRNPDTVGIGGSETAQIELARRLTSAGHDVTCYAPVPDDCTDEAGVAWRHHKDADTTAPGLWIIFRSPGAADKFEPRDDQRLILICEDVTYNEACGGAFTEERAAKFERIVGLCPTHVEYLKRAYPFLADKVSLSGNGIKTDAIQERYPHNRSLWPARDPYRIIWASSPDRGLEALLHIFHRAREFEPRLNLHCFYGFDNWDKVIAANPGCPQEKMKAGIMKLLEAGPGVTWHGRRNQPQLWEEFAQSGTWIYPSTFSETSCITCMEAQSLGAIPICAPLWGCAHNVEHGVFIQGDPSDPLVRSRYVAALLLLTQRPELAEQIRHEMIPQARTRHDWDNAMVRDCLTWADEGVLCAV